MEDGEEAHGEIKRHVRNLPRHRAQVMEGGDGRRLRKEICDGFGEDHQGSRAGVAVLGTVADKSEGAVSSMPGNEGTVAKAWVHVRDGLRVFAT